VGSRRLFGIPDEQSGAGAGYLLRSWRLPDGEAELLDTLSAAEMAGISDLVPAPDGSGWVVARGNAIWFRPLGGGGPERLLETLEAGVSLRRLSPSGVLARDEAGNASLWSFGEGGPRRAWAIRGPAGAAMTLPDESGRRVASLEPGRHFLLLRQPGGLPGARPLELRRSGA
jgi:hypothetical protein